MKTLNRLIMASLISYALIVNPNEDLSLFMIQVILFNILVLPYYVACIYVFFGLSGILMLIIAAKRSADKIRSKKILSILGIVSLYVPLIFNHVLQSFNIRQYTSPLLLAPEIMFIVLSLIILYRAVRLK